MHEPDHQEVAPSGMGTLKLLIMSCLFLGGIVGTGLVGPNRPQIEEEFAFSHGQFGLGFAVLQILAALPVLLVAGTIARLNPFRQITLGLAASSVGFAVVSFAPGASALAAGWMLIVFGSILGAVSNNVSMDLWPHHPRRGVILLHSYNAGGKVVGPLIAAACLMYGWRTSFLAAGGMTVALFAAYVLFDSPSRAFYGGTARRSGPKLSLAVLKQPRFWMVVAPIGLVAGAEAAFVTLLPTYLQHVKQLSAETASLMLTVHLLGLMAGRFLAAGVDRRVSNNTIINFCVACSLFAVPAVLADSWIIRIPALAAAGVMSSATWPTYYAQASAHLPSDRQMLAYGAFIANVLGISVCVLASSAVADLNLTASMFFGPGVFWLFLVLYYARGLHRPGVGGTGTKD